MEPTVREVSGAKREIDFILSHQDLDPYFETVYKQAQQKVNLKGFRPGHVPTKVIKQMYGKALESDAIEEAIQQVFRKYAEAQELHPVGQPTITKIDRTEDQGVTFTVAYDVMPEFELGEYKGISATKVYHIVGEQEIQEEIDRIRERYVTMEPAESVDGDDILVTLDLQKIEGGEPVEGDVNKDVKVYMRREGLNSELKDSLRNTKVGDTFRTSLPTGEDESVIDYEVTVRDIQRAVLPELDDEFARKVTGDDEANIGDLTDMVKQNIEQAYETRYGRMFRDDLINKMLEGYTFDVPEALVSEALHSFVEEMKQGPKKELPQDFDRAKFDEQMRPTAQQTVRWALIRERIIRNENLQADETDYEGLAAMEAQRTGMDYDRLIEFFRKAPAIQDRILAEKAVQLIEDYAIVQEIEDRELASQEAEQPEAEQPEPAQGE